MECKKCGASKCNDLFYKNDSTCKECRKLRVRENRREKVDYYKDYEKSRARDPGRMAARREYQKTEAGKIAHAKAGKKWNEKNPIKRAAHTACGNAMRDGKLIKMPCEICGEKKVYAHHDDYAKIFDVRWLCDTHHNDWHNENGPGVNA